MKTVFVTGADGFIGRHLIPVLKSKGYDVVGGVRNRARKLAFEKQYGKAIVCECGDAINVARAVASARPDYVIHLAGPSPMGGQDEPLGVFQSSVASWANLLDAIRRSVPRAKVVLGSSWEVYGKSTGIPWNETAGTAATSLTGSLNVSAEAVARTFYEAYHLNVTIARLFPSMGGSPSTNHFFGSVCEKLSGWDFASMGGTFQISGGPGKIDALHVGDTADALVRLMEDGKPNEIYNVCSGKAQSVKSMCESIARAFGRNVAINDSNCDAGMVCCGDNGKLTRLGWSANRTIDAAVGEMVASWTRQSVHSAA